MISTAILEFVVKLLVIQEKVQMSISISSPSNTTTNPGSLRKGNDGSFSRSSHLTLIHTIDLHNFLRTRRSIRRFKPDPVPDSVIQNILSTATYAPSAHNRQPWRFVVVTDLSVKTKLAEAMAQDFERDLTRDSLPSEKIQA